MNDPVLTTFQVDIVTSVIDLIPLLTALARRSYHNNNLKILLNFCIVAFVTDLILIYFSYHTLPTLWIGTLFSLIEFALLYQLCAGWQPTGALKRALQFGLLIILLWVVLGMAGYDFRIVLYAAKLIECIVLAAIALQTLRRFGRGSSHSPKRDPKFWISSGVLLYFAGNASVFTTTLLLGIHNTIFLHMALNLAANIFYALAFLTQRAVGSDSLTSAGQETPGLPA